jgi:hypothetical protein
MGRCVLDRRKDHQKMKLGAKERSKEMRYATVNVFLPYTSEAWAFRFLPVALVSLNQILLRLEAPDHAVLRAS